MRDFHNILFPQKLEVFLSSVPNFNCNYVQSRSGQEVRHIYNNHHRKRYILKNCILSYDDFTIFYNFFCARNGIKYAFRLHDYLDYKVDKQIIDISGVRIDNSFSIYKEYGDYHNQWKRYIKMPKEGSLSIEINDQKLQESELQYEDGKVTIARSILAGDKILLSCEFDTIVRFNDNSFDYEFNKDGSVVIKDLEIIEVL